MCRILSCFIAIIAACAMQSYNKPLFSDAEGDFYLYTGSASSQCRIISITKADYEKGMYDYLGVCGGSVHNVSEGYIIAQIEKLGARHVLTERSGDTVTKYYYSTKIPVYKRVNGKKVNLQTAETCDSYTIGSPLIFGGY